jgi:hypothetical protein
MTAKVTFAILDMLEPEVGREKAWELLYEIEKVLDEKPEDVRSEKIIPTEENERNRKNKWKIFI